MFSSSLYYGLLVFCLALGGGLITLAWQRPIRQHRLLRVLVSGGAAAALWFTAYPPQRRQPAAPAEAILLTEGYQPDTLRQLLRHLGAGTPVWHYGPAAAPAKAHTLASLLSLTEQRPALRRLHVLGWGLPAPDLLQLGSLPLKTYSLPAFHGFRAAQWNRRLTLGEMCHVEGWVAAAPGSAPVWVCLRADGATRDSMRLPTGGGRFRLRYQPKTTGLAQYELRLHPGSNQQALANEPVPVEILAPTRPAVLLLTATPSFEFKFLKNHLGEAHYPVALRSTISRGLVQTDFVNQSPQPLNRLTRALLARYAVVVTDAGSLAGLPASETHILQGALDNGQLGLVMLADNQSLPRTAPARADFAIVGRGSAFPAGPQPLTWPDAPAAARLPLPAQLRPAPTLRPLVLGPGQALVAAGRRVGLGAAVVSVVPETFRWALQGQRAVYASFWNRLLTAALPPAPAAATWSQATPWPRPGYPLTLRVAAAFPDAPPMVQPLAAGAPGRVALRQDSRLPEWSTALYWPATAGWHQVRGPGRTVHQFYVFPSSAWLGPELWERQQAARQRSATACAQGPAASRAQQPWPAAWFFGLFLLAAGFLWLEEKL
ncbi:hypothetical protein IC235_07425 [Hymenobacter sp. BT664]|uniref:Uncharacterized protein n=1 Tax=Hymenobacter montanus TaxID=2771359 RepID=A0A927BBK4_9BACT|nr:hypothetical protein [Hymenobacter montanus]MBD2767721.1 hypothetical protein [Hymenobacter montanus]